MANFNSAMLADSTVLIFCPSGAAAGASRIRDALGSRFPGTDLERPLDRSLDLARGLLFDLALRGLSRGLLLDLSLGTFVDFLRGLLFGCASTSDALPCDFLRLVASSSSTFTSPTARMRTPEGTLRLLFSSMNACASGP